MKRLSLLLAVLMAISCGSGGKEEFSPLPFPQVRMPSLITGEQEAGSFLATHFWDEFTDTSRTYPCDSVLSSGVRKTELEQAYANYAAVLNMVPLAEAEGSVERLFSRIQAVEAKDSSSNVFETLAEFTERYFYDANSPFRNEDIYRPFALCLSRYPGYPEGKRQAYAYDARMCGLNKAGTRAADFVFCDKNGKSGSLYGIKAEMTLLFFSNPGCHACKEIIDVLVNDEKISSAVRTGRLAVLNMYIDEDLSGWYDYMPVYPDIWHNAYDPNNIIRGEVVYNVRAIPSLYLLDRDKTVIMKDAPQEKVFAFLYDFLS